MEGNQMMFEANSAAKPKSLSAMAVATLTALVKDALTVDTDAKFLLVRAARELETLQPE